MAKKVKKMKRADELVAGRWGGDEEDSRNLFGWAEHIDEAKGPMPQGRLAQNMLRRRGKMEGRNLRTKTME